MLENNKQHNLMSEVANDQIKILRAADTKQEQFETKIFKFLQNGLLELNFLKFNGCFTKK